MADEPRRSGRATKGQHTKDRDDDEDDSKKKGKGKGKKAKAEPEPDEEEEEEEENEDEIIRCICGQYEEEEDNPRSMICCDSCSAWQHNDCMGLAEDYQPEKYFCELCKPQDHKKLLAAIKAGKKPWEDAARRREEAKAEKASKKKGKKGRKSGASARASDVPRTPTLEPEEPNSRKRKLADSPAPDVKAKKARASSSAREETNGQDDTEEVQDEEQLETAPQATKVDSILANVVQDAKDISNATRRNTATRIVKPFIEQTETLVQDGAISLAKGQTVQELGTRIALEVEHAVYHVRSGGSGEPNGAYREHMRTILNNIKSNTNLATRLMSRALPADELAAMEAHDMATDERKQQDAQEKANMDKQHVLSDEQEQGPRIRRTHKGEEYVDESVQIPESTSSKAPVKKQDAIDHDAEVKSPPQADASGKPQPLRKPSAAGKGQPFRDPRRKSSSNFDIDKVWSTVQGSPTATETPKLPDGRQQSSPPPPAQTATADPEIDNLLKDEENESEPYSPKEFTEEDVVWRGRVNGGNLGTFNATAKFAAGCQPDVDNLRMTWDEVLPAEIKLHGRIQPSKADDYLCGLEYSSTTELIIVSIGEPKDADDKVQFDRFFKYLKQKERYGVGMQHQVPAIKDIYLLPMEVGQHVPMVMRALEHQFADPVQERSFIVPIVIKWTDLPHNAERVKQQQEAAVMSPSVGPAVAQTPITPHEPQTQFQSYPAPQAQQYAQSTNGGGPLPSALQSPPAVAQYATPPPHGPVAHAPVHAQIPQQQPAAAINALRVLGPEMAVLPAVVNLIAQAPDAGENEFNVIKECIDENAEAGRSLPVLTQMLTAKYHSQKSSKENGAGQPQAQVAG